MTQVRLREPNAATRATVVSAIRYTFADNSQSYDELLAPLLVDFLSLMLDKDLVNHVPVYLFLTCLTDYPYRLYADLPFHL